MEIFIEEELFFESDIEQEKGLFDLDSSSSEIEPELHGVKVRIGNNPIVYNLKKLLEISGNSLTPEMQLLFQRSNIYLITHAIGVVRISGSAKVVELQYNAEVTNIDTAKTVDLLPKTKVVDKFKVETGLSGTVKAAGNFSAEIPEELKNSLSGRSLSLGGDLELELSTNTKFVGKMKYSIRLPVIQSMGISSSKCTWILKPDENPLLGDQLMVQTITVPKNERDLTFAVKGVVKVRKGWLHSTCEKETTTHIINIKLN